MKIFAGAALVLGVWRVGASLLRAAMLVVFLVALGGAWTRGLHITCGCFGHASNDQLPAFLDDRLGIARCAPRYCVAFPSGKIPRLSAIRAFAIPSNLSMDRRLRRRGSGVEEAEVAAFVGLGHFAEEKR